MKKHIELAIEVLVDLGLLIKGRHGYEFVNGPQEAIAKLSCGKTPIQRVVEAYKQAKGIEMDDKGWDKANFGRYSRAAKSMLDVFGGDLDKAAKYIILRGIELDEKGLDWTLETIARHAWDGQGMPRGATNGLRDKPLDTGIVNDGRSSRRFTQAGEIASDAIRAIEQAAIHPEKSPHVGRLDDDYSDHED